MTRIDLDGLQGSKPIGAMAAFGLLRLCRDIEGFRETRLGWVLRDDWIPFLDVDTDCTPDKLPEVIATHHAHREYPWLSWSGDRKDLKVPPGEFRAGALAFLDGSSRRNREDIDFMAAFGSEAYTDTKGDIARSLFHMTSGQQKFLGILQAIDESLKHPKRSVSSPQDALGQALFGPWLYDDSEHSIGWDPDMERMHALRHLEPSRDETNKSVRAAVWLAALSLPLFPTAPGARRLQTTGFRRTGRSPFFRWPIWESPISLPLLKSLLSHPGLQDDRYGRKQLADMGVTAVYESRKSFFGQGYGIFRPASPVFLRFRGPQAEV